jgi:NAD(P)-dependent dehydrogenase (short-subunit alcohol dehydrogenase family)
VTRSMEGKVALVTGGSSGIGRAACIRFAQEGATVVTAARRVPEGEKTTQMIRDAGSEGLFVETDISRADQVRALVATCVERYGRLDYACNNAGVEGGLALLIDYTEEQWDEVVDINLKGTWLCMKEEILAMRSRGGGAIVNVASIAGVIGFPRLAPYSATKHGMIGLTKTAAMEHSADHIRVNVILPGLIDTDMADRFVGPPESGVEDFIMQLTALRRRGTPEEVAEMILWLCSDAASYVTGSSMLVDGGATTV